MLSWKEKLVDYEFILWTFNRFDIDSSKWVREAFEAKKYAFAADYIRLFAVYNYGGIYMDMDVEVVNSFDNLLDNQIFLGYENRKKVGIEAGCFGAEKGNDFIGHCLKYYENKSFIMDNGSCDVLPLPKIMFNIYRETNQSFPLFSSDFFTAKSLKTGFIEKTKNTYAIHHFAGSWLPLNEKKSHNRRLKVFTLFGDNVFTRIFVLCDLVITIGIDFLYCFFVRFGPNDTIKLYREKFFIKK
jgi:mannosyltransferase OCH1-like enzyme